LPPYMSIPVVNYPIILNYTDKTNPDVPAIEILKSDTGTRKFSITLKSDGVALDITDLTARIYFKKADGNITQGDPTIVDAATGQISYTLQTNDVAKTGQVICQITLSDASGGRITTFYFDFDVIDTAYSDEAVQSTTEFSLLTQYADNLRHKGEYAAGTEYYINNIVEYNNSTFIALQTTQGNTPPTYPDLYNDYWYLIAQGFPVTINAEGVPITDERGYYDAGRNFTTANDISDVEAALKDLGAFKRVVPETGWIYSNDVDPIIVLKKPIAEYTMVLQSGAYASVGSFAYLDCSVVGGQYGIVVDAWADASYTYAAIMLLTDGGTSGPSPFPSSSDTYDAYFSPVLSAPVKLTRVLLDNDNFTMQWSYTGGLDTVNLTTSNWTQVSTNLIGKIPAYGDYFVKINAYMAQGGLSVYTSITDDVSGTISPLDGAFTDYLEQSRKWQYTGLVSGTGSERNIYIIGKRAGGTSVTISLKGESSMPAIIQVWPACLPVVGGVAV
jgi:hypothetical protein